MIQTRVDGDLLEEMEAFRLRQRPPMSKSDLVRTALYRLIDSEESDPAYFGAAVADSAGMSVANDG